MEMELRDEPCGLRVSAEVGTDLTKQKEPTGARKKSGQNSAGPVSSGCAGASRSPHGGSLQAFGPLPT